jgi:hypothetical protein
VELRLGPAVVDALVSTLVLVAVLLEDALGDELPQAAIATQARTANAQVMKCLMFMDMEWLPRPGKPTGGSVSRALRAISRAQTRASFTRAFHSRQPACVGLRTHYIAIPKHWSH